MVQLNEKVTSKALRDARIDQNIKKQENIANVNFLMDHDNDAVILHLENLINTYGVGKVKKHFNELTKLKKAV